MPPTERERQLPLPFAAGRERGGARLSLEERQALQAQAIADDDGEWEKELDAQNKARAGINEEDYT